MAAHNEDSRVKIPTILHLMTLGYSYLSLKSQKWDESTNIFTDLSMIIYIKTNEFPSLGDLN
jgi:type I restriction enzyme R subunit